MKQNLLRRCRWRMAAALLFLSAATPLVQQAVALPTTPGNAAMVNGVVYGDTNGNGVRDGDEAGLAGVLVSNGRDIVRSAADGAYALPLVYADDNMIFVLKPRDYALPVDSDRIPRFWYQHDPDGSPARRYAGTPPTGALPDSVDFGLLPAAEPGRFKVAVLADPQVKDEDEVAYYRQDIVTSLQRHDDIRLGFSLGDIVSDDLDLYPAINRATSALGVPWFNVFGNHDMNFDAHDDRGSDDTFESYYGPTTYALQYGPVHFIYFDNVIHWLDAGGEPRYHGGLREDQLDFIRNYLALIPRSEWVVLMMHIPLVDRAGDNRVRPRDVQRLSALLAPFPRTLSLSGHTHLQQHFYLQPADGWHGEQTHYHYNLGAASGSWWSGDLDSSGIPDTTMRDGTPNGYAVIEFSARDFRIDYHAARAPLDERLRIFGPGPVVRGSYPSADVYVNAYSAEPGDVVEYQVDNGAWQAMLRVQEHDPYVTHQNLRRMTATLAPRNERLSAAIPSTHLWKARVETDYLPGAHRLRVRTRDRYGREFSAESTFQVVELEPPH